MTKRNNTVDTDHDYPEVDAYIIPLKHETVEEYKLWSTMNDELKTYNVDDYVAPETPDYKYNEAELIAELKRYVDATYDEHYSHGKIQATEEIIDDGWGEGFCIGNAKKYLKRYGKKGETPAEWRKDLIKVLHYGLIMLYVHDQKYGTK